MLDFGFYNEDCLPRMKEYPDKFFSLAITDPPYGICLNRQRMGAGGGKAGHKNRSSMRVGGGGC